MMNNNNNVQSNSGLGSFIVTLLKVLVIAIVAVYAKRFWLTRPFYWFIVQFAAVFIGVMFMVGISLIITLFSHELNKALEMVYLCIGSLIALGSIQEVVGAMDALEMELFDEVTYISPIRKVIGFAVGIAMHVMAFNSLGGF